MSHLQPRSLVASVLALLLWGPALHCPRAAEPPDFREVFDLVRSNLVGVIDADLQKAALRGVLDQFRPRVVLVTNASSEAASSAPEPLLGKTEVFEGSFAYLRIARVDAGLASLMSDSIGRLASSNDLKGLVLDLRFAGGGDYSTAAEVADQFITTERVLLRWGAETRKSTAKTNVFRHPLAVLVNSGTTGAAEALAAVLREAEVGLLLGTPTAGQGYVFREFPLSNGQRLRLAGAPVDVGDGRTLGATPVAPDIQVPVDPAEEREHFADYYKVIAVTPSPATGKDASTNLTSRPPRVNEAELVRMMRRIESDEDQPPGRRAPSSAPEKPVVRDPALARALDLLKGLAVVRPFRGS